jgi:hypothetical protein
METEISVSYTDMYYIFPHSLQCRTITRGVPWVSTPSEEEIPNTARCMDTAFHILTFYALILYMYIILNNIVCHIDYLF